MGHAICEQTVQPATAPEELAPVLVEVVPPLLVVPEAPLVAVAVLAPMV